jgi:hypothetical protein
MDERKKEHPVESEIVLNHRRREVQPAGLEEEEHLAVWWQRGGESRQHLKVPVLGKLGVAQEVSTARYVTGAER